MTATDFVLARNVYNHMSGKREEFPMPRAAALQPSNRAGAARALLTAEKALAR